MKHIKIQKSKFEKKGMFEAFAKNFIKNKSIKTSNKLNMTQKESGNKHILSPIDNKEKNEKDLNVVVKNISLRTL